MSIQTLVDHELRSLVRYGSHKFAAQASAEIERRAARKTEDGGSKIEDGGREPVATAEVFPCGRWS